MVRQSYPDKQLHWIMQGENLSTIRPQETNHRSLIMVFQIVEAICSFLHQRRGPLPSNPNTKKSIGKLETLKDSNLESGSHASPSRPHTWVERDNNIAISKEDHAALAAAEAACAAAHAAAKAYASSEVKRSMLPQLPKIPSFHKFARREQYVQMDEYDLKGRWSCGALGKQDCISEIDSRNCIELFSSW